MWGLQPNVVVPFAFGHDAQLMACALMPVVLLAVDAVATARARVAPTLGLALAVACELMAGHPQITVLTAGLAAAYALERAWSRGEAVSLAWAACGGLLGAAMASSVWWPALLYNAESVRAAAAGGVGALEVSTWSLAWRDLVAQMWPWAVGFGGTTYWGGLDRTDFPPYVGLAPALLAAVAIVAGARARGSGTRFWSVAAALGMLLALGTRLGPIQRLLYEHVPMWSAFRVAANTVVITELAVALLAARGIDRLISNPRERPRLAIAALVTLLAIGLGPGDRTARRFLRRRRAARAPHAHGGGRARRRSPRGFRSGAAPGARRGRDGVADRRGALEPEGGRRRRGPRARSSQVRSSSSPATWRASTLRSFAVPPAASRR